MEMSFVEQEDVFQAIEPVMRGVFEEFGEGRPVTQQFPRIPYAEAMLKYGSDKPDLRNPIAMQVVSDAFAGSGFKIFAGIVEKGGQVRAIPAPGGGSRAFCDRMNSWGQKQGLPGMGYIFWREKTLSQDDVDNLTPEFQAYERELLDANALAASGGQSGVSYTRYNTREVTFSAEVGSSFAEGSGPLAKNIGPARTEALRQKLGLGPGDAAFFLAGEPAKFEAVAGRARDEIWRELGMFGGKADHFEFAWIVDFPMYERDPDTGAIDFSHNPFSMPQGGLEALNGPDPLAVKGYQYDIVCNGVELSSGAIRNHVPEIMYRAFEIVGKDRAFVDDHFGGMVNAFRYGAPPHGGIAPGIDRMVMLLAGADNLRDVIMFPMNQRAEDLMMGAPSAPDNAQLRELGLRFIPQD
jgi:aspartyl-tRNA synthetase